MKPCTVCKKETEASYRGISACSFPADCMEQIMGKVEHNVCPSCDGNLEYRGNVSDDSRDNGWYCKNNC